MKHHIGKISLTYNINDATLANICSFERNFAKLESLLMSNTVVHDVKEGALIKNMRSFSTLLDLNYTAAQVRKIRFGVADTSNKGEVLLQNIRQIYDFLINNSAKGMARIDNYIIQHFIKLLHTNILDSWEVAKVRNDGDLEGNKLFELENQVYMQDSIQSHIFSYISWQDENGDDIHPLINATVTLVFFNILSPFSGLNFIFSIILFHMLVEKYGYGLNFLIPVISAIKSEDVTNSLNDFLRDIESQSSDMDISDVLQSISKSLGDLMSEEIKQYDKYDMKSIQNKIDTLDLNDRQLKVLKILETKNKISRQEYSKLFRVSAMTSYRDLNHLYKKSLLTLEGVGKATKYLKK